MDYRPLSTRGKPDPRFDEAQAGLPDYLLQPVVNWVGPLIWNRNPLFGPEPNVEVLQEAQVALRVSLDWTGGGDSAASSLVRRMGEDREFALDVLDYLVQKVADDDHSEKLAGALATGGSEWCVESDNNGVRRLAKRAIGPVRDGIEVIHTTSQRAHHHLTEAWRLLGGRQPDASGVYREAIKAVEAVARPVVSPKNDRTTLGTIIRDLRAKPKKWTVALDGASAEDVADIADLIWKGQVDRHGSDDESVPLAVTLEEADAAFYIAMTLTRWFAQGHIRSGP